jgi:hypothetical protein
VAAVVQDAAQGDVVQVVARRVRKRPVLAPARQPPVHEPRIPREARFRPEPESLHDARAETLDQPVRPLDEAQHHFRRPGLLEVERDRALAAPREVVLRPRPERQRAALAVDEHDLGAEVGEQHAAERPGADAGELDDADPLQRSHGPTASARRFLS